MSGTLFCAFEMSKIVISFALEWTPRFKMYS